MTFTTPEDGVAYTDAEPDDITAYFQGLAGASQIKGRTWGGGDFVSATDGGKFPGRPRTYQAVVAGGAAGDITVTGITTDDDLVGVIEFASGVPTDRTAEFTITATNTINNTGGTSTAGDTLVVTYTRRGNYDHMGLTFPAGEDTKAAVYLEAPAEWESVEIHALLLAESFGSGTVRWGCAGTSDVVEVEVAAFYVGELAFPTGLTWSAGSGEFAHLQFAQLPLVRVGTHNNDDLEQGISVCKLIVAEGA